MTTHAGADQPGDGAEPGFRPVEDACVGVVGRHVGGAGHGSPARIKDLARDCLCCFGIEVDDCGRSSLGEGAKRDCLADTLPAACPNDDLARKHALQFDLPLFGQDT